MSESIANDSRPGALAGTTVLEWSYGRPGAYAGKLLRGFGAEVILAERDSAARTRLGLPGVAHAAESAAIVRFLHGGKRSVLLDPSSADGQALFDALLASADILVMDQPLIEADALGLSPESLAERHPRLVVVATSLRGLEQPFRYERYADVVAHAVGGIAYSTPKIVPDVQTYPPLKPGGYQADYSLGLAAANAVLLGLHWRRRTGAGSLIDVSAQAMLASYMRQDVTPVTFTGDDQMKLLSVPRQSPNGRFSSLSGLIPCKDGYFAFQASEQYQWAGLMRMMGDPAWSKELRFALPLDRVTYWDEIEPHFVAWCMEHTKREIFHAGQAEHVPVFPCYAIDELLADEQQIARGFFIDLPTDAPARSAKVPGAIVHLDRTPWRPRFDPPALGDATAEARQRLAAAQTQ